MRRGVTTGCLQPEPRRRRCIRARDGSVARGGGILGLHHRAVSESQSDGGTVGLTDCDHHHWHCGHSLTAGAAAGPFIAALGANASQIATTMVLSAVAKVGIQKAIEGEGYDLTSVDTLIDGVGAAIEGGLFVAAIWVQRASWQVPARPSLSKASGLPLKKSLGVQASAFWPGAWKAPSMEPSGHGRRFVSWIGQ